MTIRLYLHTTPKDCQNPMLRYVEAGSKDKDLYPGMITWGHCEQGRLAIWILFESDEEAAIFKLRDWRE